MSKKQDITFPIRVSGLEDVPIVKVSASPYHVLALSQKGTIYSWGDPQYGALGRQGNPNLPGLVNHPPIKFIKFRDIACGGTFSMALTTKGQLYTWGTYMGSKEIYGYLPHVKIQYHPRIVDHVSTIPFISIAAGATCCLALDVNGQVYSWGCGEFDQLGIPGCHNKQTKLDLIPKKIALNRIVHIACGQFHSLAINAYGQLFAWGANKFHQCGIMSMSEPKEDQDTAGPESIVAPQLVTGFKNCVGTDVGHLVREKKFGKRSLDEMQRAFAKRLKITAEDQYNMMMETDAVLEKHHRNIRQPVQQPGPISVAAGADHTVVQMSDHSLVAFGRNDHGQLGIVIDEANPPLGAIRSKDRDFYYAVGIPLRNPWVPPVELKKGISGFDHVLAIGVNGQVWGYGSIEHHQLGTYEVADVTLPSLLESIQQRGRVIDGAANDATTYFIVAENEQ
ncbi:regulator of chromosome condensation 1/beta-lactamase-inhibitor protein II [Blakeslea trispora]|nr:regulator of chromosome condensation 1/beta-lactamase-inhibitor protein II [Blakeslea trispora]